MPFENVEEVKEVRDPSLTNIQLAAGWSVLGIVPGFDGQKSYALYVLGKIVSEEDKVARALLKRSGLYEVMCRVCETASTFLTGYDLPLQVLRQYHDDAKGERLDPKLLRGFLKGLYAARLLDAEGLADLESELC